MLLVLYVVDEDWIEPDSQYVLLIRQKQSASRGEIRLPSTATSTHTVIITTETYESPSTIEHNRYCQ